MRGLPWILDVLVAVELEVSREPMGGLYAARLSLGTPPQELWAGIDTASDLLWVPARDFDRSASSSFQEGGNMSVEYADGFRVVGNASQETAGLGGLRVAGAPFMLASNVSRGPGLLGLEVPEVPARDSERRMDSFFAHVWREHPELPRVFRLELGGQRPRLLFGAEAQGGSPALAADRFTRRSSKWYVGVRAMGMSSPQGASLGGSLDFNDLVEHGNPRDGIPALLDSGSGAIRLSARIFDRLMRAMPEGCQRADGVLESVECPCRGPGEFPSISISFESAVAWRFLGLDTGDDFIVCVPPTAYMRELAHKPGWCQADIVGVPTAHSRVFGSEAIVLGVPFFRAAAVVFDLDRRQIGLDSQSGDSAGRCADPKNVLRTGHRFSLLRFALVFAAAAATSVLVHERYSRSSWFRVPSLVGQMSRGHAGRTLRRIPGEGEAFVELTSGAP